MEEPLSNSFHNDMINHIDEFKIIFLESVHPADDERVLFHQAWTLFQHNLRFDLIAAFCRFKPLFSPYIIARNHCTRKEWGEVLSILKERRPNVIVCDTPFSLSIAIKYKRSTCCTKCRVIYDVTEFYPSKKNLIHTSGFNKVVRRILLHVYDKWFSWQADGFIFGEIDKSIIYRRLFPKTPYIFLPYYPMKSYIRAKVPHDISKEYHLFYAGNLNEEKGYGNMLNVVLELAHELPDVKIMLSVLTQDSWCCKHLVNAPVNLIIDVQRFLPFRDFCDYITNQDFFFGLRRIVEENDKCLPIKLFYYMACGRPVIYSALKAIVKGCPEIADFGYLVNPIDIQQIVKIIRMYIHTPILYLQHCKNARQLHENKYNWESSL